ncbi:T0157082 isoform 1, partial [Pongo abelii]
LSFLCRYVPVGLLERLPQRINERPPYYLGRDYLETLMASQKAADWIRIRLFEPVSSPRPRERGVSSPSSRYRPPLNP